MTNDSNETELKKYFKKHKIKSKAAADAIGITPNQMYLILKGACRPGHQTAKRIQEYINNALTIKQIRPELTRPKCDTCGRLLKKHHLIELRAKTNKEKKKIKPEIPTKTLEKPKRKKAPSLLSIL